MVNRLLSSFVLGGAADAAISSVGKPHAAAVSVNRRNMIIMSAFAMLYLLCTITSYDVPLLCCLFLDCDV
jgi:hypothetical protein